MDERRKELNEQIDALKKIRKDAGMNRREFSEYIGIPLRTLEEWEAGRRKMPEYVLRLLVYQIRIKRFLYEKGLEVPTEDEEQRYGRNKQTVINHTYINSGVYRRKFDMISASGKLNRLLYRLAKKMLEHRSGTKYEDMYWIDPESIMVVAEETESNSEEEIVYRESLIPKIRQYGNLVTIHSHPNSFPPSINDLNSNYSNHYSIGIVVCHDGRIFMYSSGQEINEDYYKLTVEEYLKSGYNEYEAQMHALTDLQSRFDILIKEVTDNDA